MLTKEEMEQMLSQMRYRYLTVTFSAPATLVQIAHGLNRIPKRWPIVQIDDNATIYGTADEANLNLYASAPCVAVLEVG